ncbi:MAG: RNA methyltransferase, partial [Bacteroidaceae bacterium]|nr:RNA methyltransferase [Bacteroidaceae bacterium]
MISKNRLKYVRSLEMKKYRKAEGVFVAEGHKLVGDLLDVFECKYLAATSEWLSANAAWVERQRRSGVEVDEVTDEELKRASFQETPQQVLAVFKQLTYEVDVNEVARKQLCLVLDDVQNPGNLGTIVRLADWFGIEHIFCSKGCADIYNPKTVQATMGGIARVQVHEADLSELLSKLDKDIPVYGTFLDGENIYGKELENRGLIVMGNEGKGVSKEVEAFVTERLYIPNYPEGRETSESLNVAIAT